ncbi:hypothetical protein Ppb6_03040 [Photorhabdus australis subsp. thailandensis]|uniref:Uncharacterized protein n=1 Tax=Photorhabdus australis subsp. thailandensis TaxID=2805096 RepID=A0A1C0U216_9GAMM|nr:hypothetical protein Ppb6_03040 [Photorhabdus australis subsp. thailandensis]
MVDYLYIIFSLLALYPLYIAFKKLLTPYDVYINYSSVLLMMASNIFHLHVFHTGQIPFLGVSVSDNDFMLYTRHLSSCFFVGCTHSPRSHSSLCSRGFAPWPSRCILKSIGYTLLLLYLFRALLHL